MLHSARRGEEPVVEEPAAEEAAAQEPVAEEPVSVENLLQMKRPR